MLMFLCLVILPLAMANVTPMILYSEPWVSGARPKGLDVELCEMVEFIQIEKG